jgi:hypothetical protein
MKSIAIKNAFPGGAHGACWLDDDRIASAGADGTVKVVSLAKLKREYSATDSFCRQHTITRVAA